MLNEKGVAAIHTAIFCYNTSLVEDLIKYGADPNQLYAFFFYYSTILFTLHSSFR